MSNEQESKTTETETIQMPVEIRVSEETPEQAEERALEARRRGVMKLASHLLIEWSCRKPNCDAKVIGAMAPQALAVAVAISGAEDGMEELLLD